MSQKAADPSFCQRSDFLLSRFETKATDWRRLSNRCGLIAAFTAVILSMIGCAVHSRSASLEIGDSFCKEVYLVKGNRLLKKSITNGKLKEQLRVKLTDWQARDFWASIEASQVSKWSSVYLPKEETERTAITSWAIELKWDGFTKSVGGGGAFPGDDDLSKPVGPEFSDRFARLVSAFDKLEKAEN